MIKKVLFFIFSVLLVVTTLTLVQTGETNNMPIIKVSIKDCTVQQKKCKLELDEFNIEISMNTNIFYLKKFNIDVWIESKGNTNIESIQADFIMKNMNMGVNHFILNKMEFKNKKQNWQGSALLPICVTGRADWFSELSIVTKKNKYIVEFPIIVKK